MCIRDRDETVRKFITDKRTGLRYELVGDYYLIAGEEEPEQEPIGIWGRRHLHYLKEHRRVCYANLLTTGKLNDYLADLNERAEAMFSQLDGSSQSGKPNALGAENEQSSKCRYENRFKRAYLPLGMTAIQKEHKCVSEKPVYTGFLFICGEPKKVHRLFYPNSRR